MKKQFEKNIGKILNIFIIIQPILDAITGICINYLNINTTFSSIIRFSFIILCIYYIIFIKKDKKDTKKIAIILLYILAYTINILIIKNTNAIKYELQNALNTFYLPITLIAISNIYKTYNIKIKYFNITYLLYIILIIIPNITNTGFNSYSHSKIGNVGWFYSANAIGNILSITLPFIIYYLLNSKKKIINIIIIISILYVFAIMGTKVPILSLALCIISNLLFFIIKWIKNKEKKKIIKTFFITTLISLIAVLAIPKTNFFKNIEIHKNYLGINHYYEIINRYDLIDHFIFSQRLTFLQKANKNYLKSNISEKILGIGYIENYNTENTSTKTIEIDYFDIFYRQGIIGFIIYISTVAPYIINKIKNLKEKTLLNQEYKLSIILILLLALFSGHTLTVSPVSIFVSIIIGGKYEKIERQNKYKITNN